MKLNLKDFLEEKYSQYNTKRFLEDDPIGVPHRFSNPKDIEIVAFWTAILAWGQRKTIINKCNELFSLMDNDPFEFVTNHAPSDLKRFLSFKHRTFNADDTLYFVSFLKDYYGKFDSLEDAFLLNNRVEGDQTKAMLSKFHSTFFSLPDFLPRTRKHVATPDRKSACKRINMFLRWMVRKDTNGVDFGIWDRIKTSDLVCPLDVHVARVSTKLGLLKRTQRDWQAARELTDVLKTFDPNDPVKYDFALFGIGAYES